MADQEQGAVTVYSGTAITDAAKKNHPFSVKVGLAQVLRGGAIVEVSSVNEAKIAESAGACSVIVSDPIRSHGGIRRMPDPVLIKEVKRAVSVPVMARARVGHFVEAQILESLAVDYIDESEEISVADEEHFINKHNFRSPIICGCRDTGEALRRIREGAAMIRIQGDLNGTGNIVETVKSVRLLMGEVRKLNNMDDDEVFDCGGDSFKRVRSIVQAVQHYNDPHVLAEMSSGLEREMEGLSVSAGGGDRIQDFGQGSV